MSVARARREEVRPDCFEPPYALALLRASRTQMIHTLKEFRRPVRIIFGDAVRISKQRNGSEL